MTMDYMGTFPKVKFTRIILACAHMQALYPGNLRKHS